jgi:16S rRNA G1207 methylase RsmC
MNPPFSDGQASAHIRHAWEFLRPGGTLVAVADKGVTFRSDKRTVAFREWLSKIGATVTALPSKSFSESGTDVETVTIVATKE